MNIFKKIKKLFDKREIKFFYQRITRGWDDSETWSLDQSLSKIILPRLKRFKDIKCAYPTNLSPKEWNEILDKMIYSFEFYATGKQYGYFKAEQFEQADEGLRLFGEHFGSLWW